MKPIASEYATRYTLRSIVDLLVPMQGPGGSGSYNGCIDGGKGRAGTWMFEGTGDRSIVDIVKIPHRLFEKMSCSLSLRGSEVMVSHKPRSNPCCPYIKTIPLGNGSF